jgi:hypothetical protein
MRKANSRLAASFRIRLAAADYKEIQCAPSSSLNHSNRSFSEHNCTDSIVALQYFDKPPNIMPAWTISKRFARATERSRRAPGVPRSIEAISVNGCRSVHLILKVPQASAGLIYIGSLTLPFRDFSYVVRVQCAEGGLSGIRNTTILAELINTGEVKFDEGQTQPTGWWTDPCNLLVGEPPARNLSELPRYDARFPDHALSRLRRIFPRIEATLRLPEYKFASKVDPTRKVVQLINPIRKDWNFEGSSFASKRDPADDVDCEC